MTSNLLDTTPKQESPLQSRYSTKYFFKYPKIKNLASSVIYDDPTRVPDNGFPSVLLQKEAHLSFYVSEKIDGCNLGMYIPREGDPYFFSRNGEDANGLFDFEKDKNQLKRFVQCIQEFINTDAIEDENVEGLYFWGEYFGYRINRRINYGHKGRFRFYDAMVVTKQDLETKAPNLLTPLFFMFLCVNINLYATKNGYFGEFADDSLTWEFFYPPDFDFESANREAILEQFKPENHDSIFAVEKHYPEGYVITAADDEKVIGKWKIKAESFKERERQPKLVKTDDDELVRARTIFNEFLTVARAHSVLSKTTERSLKVILPMFVEDAKEDFLEEYPEMKRKDKKWLKAVFNAGKIPFLTMTKALEEEKA